MHPSSAHISRCLYRYVTISMATILPLFYYGHEATFHGCVRTVTTRVTFRFFSMKRKSIDRRKFWMIYFIPSVPSRTMNMTHEWKMIIDRDVKICLHIVRNYVIDVLWILEKKKKFTFGRVSWKIRKVGYIEKQLINFWC